MQIIFVQPLAIRIADAYLSLVPITARRNLHGANMRKSSKIAKPAKPTLDAINAELTRDDASTVAPAARDLSGLAALGRAIENAATVARATKPAKPAIDAETAAIAAAARTVAAAGYNGPSLAVRHGNPKIAALIARVKSPVQIADNLTVRDLSGLAAIKSVADAATGEFNPLAIKLDAGVCSRLASRGLIAVNAAETGLRLTDTGRNTKA